MDPWRQSADDGSVASHGSRLSALAPEAELGALIDKVDMISRTFNIFRVDTKARDRDLGDTIYTMRGKMERQQIALEDLRRSNRDLEIRINNLSFFFLSKFIFQILKFVNFMPKWWFIREIVVIRSSDRTFYLEWLLNYITEWLSP